MTDRNRLAGPLGQLECGHFTRAPFCVVCPVLDAMEDETQNKNIGLHISPRGFGKGGALRHPSALHNTRRPALNDPTIMPYQVNH